MLLVSTVHRGGVRGGEEPGVRRSATGECRAVGRLWQVVPGDRQAGDGRKTLEVQRRLLGRTTEKTIRHVDVRRRCDAGAADRMRDIADQRDLRAAVRCLEGRGHVGRVLHDAVTASADDELQGGRVGHRAHGYTSAALTSSANDFARARLSSQRVREQPGGSPDLTSERGEPTDGTFRDADDRRQRFRTRHRGSSPSPRHRRVTRTSRESPPRQASCCCRTPLCPARRRGVVASAGARPGVDRREPHRQLRCCTSTSAPSPSRRAT